MKKSKIRTVSKSEYMAIARTNVALGFELAIRSIENQMKFLGIKRSNIKPKRKDRK